MSLQFGLNLLFAVFHEALQRAGRDLTRARLIDALETLNHLDIGSVPLNFSHTNHQGLENEYLVQLKDGALVPVKLKGALNQFVAR